MRLLYENRAERREVELAGVDPSANVRDLLCALGLPSDTSGLWVDGRWAPHSTRLSEVGLLEGARLSLNPPTPSDRGGVGLEVVGGLQAGDRVPLRNGRITLGRSPGNDLTIASASLRPQHAVLEQVGGRVQMRGTSSHSSTQLCGSAPLRLGDLLVQVTEAPDDQPHRLAMILGRTVAGRIAFNRPPRSSTPPPPAALAAPAAESSGSQRAAFGWAAVVGPLVFGVFMAVLYSPYMALFSLLSVFMIVGTWLDGRWRDRSRRRRSSRRTRAALGEFAAAAEQAHGVAAERLRSTRPPLSEAVRRARGPSVRLWERRTGHDDFGWLVVGNGQARFRPELDVDGPEPDPGVESVLEALGPLRDVPVCVRLRAGELVGLVGPRAVTGAIARSLLVQAAAHHGPADLRIVVATGGGASEAWEWARWLPHTRLGSGRRVAVAAGREAVAELCERMAETHSRLQDEHAPQVLAVVDGDDLAVGRAPPAGALLRGACGPAAGLVLAERLDRLPASCSAVVEAHAGVAEVVVTWPGSGETSTGVLPTGMDVALASEAARSMARLEDPELAQADTGIPDRVRLLGLIGAGHLQTTDEATADLAELLEGRWAVSADGVQLAVPVGADGHGPLVVDLVADGPHVLVGGTTGSGKSELLRTLVASLAASADPDHVNFVLVDYKGGSAFDACAGLPHTVGLVTDLDGRLAERALCCLEAELRHRERLLRCWQADDLAAYRKLRRLQPNMEPLPRLVVIVDEFATLAAELPEFMDSLVNVAQRGRSLGVHLVLATQRPQGAVSPGIKTNTSIRIALRMLDEPDSLDVLGGPQAAGIGREQPGRAFIRLGPGELIGFQSALVTGTNCGPTETGLRVLRAANEVPLANGLESPRTRPDGWQPAGEAAEAGLSDLELLVAAARQAQQRSGRSAPRRPWPDPLPSRITLEELQQLADARQTQGAHYSSGGAPLVPVGLADHPDEQTQSPLCWDPGAGNMLLIGILGSGTGAVLGSLAAALAARFPPAALHLYAMDGATAELAPLAGLAHCGAVIGADEHDRTVRLIRRLSEELQRRTAAGCGDGEPLLLTLVSSWGAIVKRLDTVADHAHLSTLERLWAEGPAVGICFAAAAEQLSDASRSVQAATPQTFVSRLTDPTLYRQWGVDVEDPLCLPAGRAFTVPGGTEVQFAEPAGGLAAAVTAIRGATPPDAAGCGPAAVENLPERVSVGLLGQAQLHANPVYLPLGLSDDTLSPTGIRLYAREHALVVGPARSGRSSALLVAAAGARRVGVRVLAHAGAGSPLADCDDVEMAAADVSELCAAARDLASSGLSVLVLIDDADVVEDTGGALSGLLAAADGLLHVVAAGRADRLRSCYGHWTGEIRFSRTGLLLQPTLLDGDLFGVQLPAKVTLATIPGRGWLVQNGEAHIVQVAVPESRSAAQCEFQMS